MATITPFPISGLCEDGAAQGLTLDQGDGSSSKLDQNKGLRPAQFHSPCVFAASR